MRHSWPYISDFAGFKGGKAVATSAGMLLGFNPVFFVYSCIIFIVSLFCTSMVSLSSMISAVLITLSTIVLPYVAPVILAKPNWLLTIIAFLVSSFIFYRHKDNIKRIRNHTESRIPFGLNSSKKNPDTFHSKEIKRECDKSMSHSLITYRIAFYTPW